MIHLHWWSIPLVMWFVGVVMLVRSLVRDTGALGGVPQVFGIVAWSVIWAWIAIIIEIVRYFLR